MKKRFELGQNSLNVAQTIIRNHPKIRKLTLISHSATINWRQRNTTTVAKAADIKGALFQERPATTVQMDRNDFLNVKLDNLSKSESGVWSLTSKVILDDGSIRHLAVMNFHPEPGITIDDISILIQHIVGSHGGVLLNSGRYFHYYGNFLLTHEQWIEFYAKFLIPCDFVSPRYIGHRLQDGYGTLRLTTDREHKPTVPLVIKLL